MPELQDIRGQTYSWLLRRKRPFACRLYLGSEIVGELIQPSRYRPITAEFAGIDWRIERISAWRRLEEHVSFAGCDFSVAQVFTTRDEFLNSNHLVRIDEAEEYSLKQTSYASVSWRDKAAREPVKFRRLQDWGEAGECEVSPDAVLTHAPILLLVGVLRAVQRRVFGR